MRISRVSFVILILIIFFGAFLRFYKLDWGEGYFFHPDEYHIAAAVGRLSFPFRMNPELFSYGSFTVYLIYFTKLIFSTFNFQLSTFSPILVGRFYSALFSTLTILAVYLISRLIFREETYSLPAAFLTAVSPGLIQQAHFATPESSLTFWLFLALCLWLLWLTKQQPKYFFFAAVCLGLALATKIVALTFLPILIILPWFSGLPIQKAIKLTIFPLFILVLVFLTAFPFAVLDWSDFRSSMNYETGVGRGEPLVFYTRQFIDTTPLLFQYQKILPYALGPVTLILGSLGFLLMFATVILNSIQNLYLYRSRIKCGMTNKKAGNRKLLMTYELLLITAFLLFFLPNAFLFAKWTRFIAPSFPFFAIFTTYLISKTKNKFLLITHYSLLITNVFWTFMFFSIYLRPDVRVTATDWLNQNLSPNSFILTEQGNMIEVPLEGNLAKKALDFYHLEEDPHSQYQLLVLLPRTDYFIVQSRRIFANHQRLPEQFPQTAWFCDLLFSGQLGFEKIKEFSSFPQFSILNFKFSIPDEVGEETWSVFDHPVIRVYKKVKPLSKQDYETLLQI